MSPTKTEAELKREIFEDQERYASAKQIEDHERRLRDLETWRSWMTGVGFCVNAVVLVAIGVCTWMVTSGIAEVLQRLPVKR